MMRSVKLLVTLLISIGIIMSCSKQPIGGVTKKVLDNGLTVLVKEDHSSPVAAIVTWVNTGYFNEPDSLTGVSHLLEHMYFKGTERRGVGELARETKDAGGYLNAGTIYEYTSYYTILPSYSFEKGLDIQSDALKNSAIDAEELAKEAQVVIQEVKRKLDNPNSYSYEKLLELGFDKHRLRRWRMGYEEQLAGWTRDHIYNYYRTRYRPENIILSVVGDIDTDEALKLIDKYYADIEPGEFKTEFSPPEPPQQTFKYRRMTGDVNRNLVYAGFHVPGALHDDFYPLTVMNFILGDGRASRLYQEVKEEQQLAQTVESFYFDFKDFGYFSFTMEQDKEDPLDVIKAIFKQLERFKLEKVSQAELTRAINQLESGYLHTFEEFDGLAQALARFESYDGYQSAFTYLDKLRQVTAEDIQRVARQYFDITNAAVLEYLPDDHNFQDFSAKQLQVVLNSTIEEYRNDFLTGEDTEYASGSQRGVGNTKLPDKPSDVIKLDNGITVICKENHSLPLVSVASYFYGGTFTESVENSGISQLMVRTALKGTGSMSAAQIAERTEILGSSIGYEIDDDYFGFSLESMSRNFENGFEILSDVMLNPSFPEEELAKEKEYLKAAINRQKDSMGGYPIELVRQALYEGHPYGLPSLGREEAIANITVDDLKNRHEQGIRTGNLVIAFVGDITIREAKNLTEKYLSGMERGDRIQAPAQKLELSSIHTLIDKREKAQTAQAFAFPSCKYADPDHEPLKVLQNVVSGMGARLWMEVRDKRSLAYTVYGYQSAAALAGSFICYVATSPENALEARQVAMDVLTGLPENPPTEEELQRSINYTAGSFSIYLQTNAVQADLYAWWELAGKGFKAVDEYPDKIRRVTGQQVLDVARKYFIDSHYAVGMIEGVGASVKQRE